MTLLTSNSDHKNMITEDFNADNKAARERLMKFHGMTEAEAIKHIEATAAQSNNSRKKL